MQAKLASLAPWVPDIRTPCILWASFDFALKQEAGLEEEQEQDEGLHQEQHQKQEHQGQQ